MADSTAIGAHLAFLETVRDEVHYSAEAKRNQLAEKYSNATIESMVRGIKWAEAAERVSALTDLPAEVVQKVTRVLRRELTLGTLERIDELLTASLQALRDSWEDSRIGGSLDSFLDSTLGAGLIESNEQIRQFWIQQFGMPEELTYEQGKAWAKRRQAESDANAKNWHERVAGFERAIEERCRARILAAGFREEDLEHGQHVRCLPGFVDVGDPRMPAYGEAMRCLRMEQQGIFSLLGHDEVPNTLRPSSKQAEAGGEPSRKKSAKPNAEHESTGDHAAAIKLWSIYTNGVSDERLKLASSVLLNCDLTIDQKLQKIDEAVPIPPSASAAKLGSLLGVSKTAIQKTPWYIKNRKGERESLIGRRRQIHRERGTQLDSKHLGNKED